MESIAVIVDTNNHQLIVGTGVLVGDDMILTCAHVVNSALGLDQTAQDKPIGKGIVSVQFPSLSQIKTLSTEIIYWSPLSPDNNRTIDLAVLKLRERLPVMPQPSKLSLIDDYDGRLIKIFGFPNGFKNGAWAFGKVDGKLANHCYQISGDDNPFSMVVEAGFSGTPVFDKQTNQIIGILQSKRSDLGKRIYYILPTVAILEKYHHLGRLLEQNGLTDQLIKRLFLMFRDSIKHTIHSSISGIPAASLVYYLERKANLPTASSHPDFDLDPVFKPYVESNITVSNQDGTMLDSIDFDDLDFDDLDDIDPLSFI